MRDIACVMITCDRSPQKNYLQEAVKNLARGGGLRYPFHLFFTERNPFPWGSGRVKRLSYKMARQRSTWDWADSEVRRLWVDGEQPGLNVSFLGYPEESSPSANHNVANALSFWGGAAGIDFVLFLEDDIDVCADFFDSVGAWLDDHAREDRRIYSFGANYPQVQELYDQGVYAWDYPIEKFYGTQAFAIRPDDALSLAEYIRSHCYDRSPDGTQWDLLMQDWSREKYPEIDHFLASCPAFVDHIGEESVVMPGRKGHRYPSWPGVEWSYLKERER